ncbi:MAG: hypothetical protein YSLV7_ORF11 [Yellowstone Lake virophage 7]|uniref:hypothetical protein n=1 Tax=Yellowstone Lake virophage 7 TaxID=1557035 RepID=UPI000535A344|nr:MAG: hypothetical protein ASQ67_gp11 [Yellowstone Lake virophage 7]AIW01930.1 MAG: hypothetical protein YSLV7_ORF11 [Yellowstone Lake virophage 7]
MLKKKYNDIYMKIQTLNADIAKPTTPKHLVNKYKKELKQLNEEYAILEDELNPGGESYYFERNRPMPKESNVGYQMLNDEY